ncbi:MAG: GNAT family N-acetyltransferase [Planctomycetota bacterium]
MKLHVVRDLNGIEALKQRWTELDQDHPFRSFDWYFSWFEHCSSGEAPYVITDQNTQSETQMIAPFYSTTTRLGGRKLCLAADGHVCTDYGQIASHDLRFESNISNLMWWLASGDPWHNHAYCEFDGLPQNCSTTLSTLSELNRVGFEPEIFELQNCWEVGLPETWEELNARFSKKHRRKTKKALSNLDNCEVHSLADSDFDSLWPEFVRLHQMRRTQVGDPGCFADSNFERFLRHATRRLGRRDLADVHIVESKNQPVAASLSFFSPTKTFMYQTGFDPGFSKLEPGYMLIVAALRQAIARRHRYFDFMRGDEPYKQRWNADAVPMLKLRFRIHDSFRNRIEDRLRWSRDILKSSFKQLRGQSQYAGA